MLTFRPATAADAAVVHDITHRAYAVRPPLDPPSGALTETVDAVRADLTVHGGLLAVVDDTVVGSLRFRFDGTVSWLRRVGVVPEHARRGVGTQLVTHAHVVLAHTLAEVDAAELRVGVRFALADNRRFWESLSYAETGNDDHSYLLSRPPPYVATVPTAADMRELGARLASLLRPGDLVLCIGELGAGKTTLAQGVAAALGVSDPVTSPTFVLARVHTGRETPFVHADAYRLGGVDDPLGELDALDLDATLEDAVTLIEWGGGLAERLAPARVEVRISVSAEEVRHVVVDALGVRWAGVDMRTGFGTSRSLG